MNSLKNNLLGAWSLVSYTAKDANGNVSFPMGIDAKGIIMYTADGYMSAQIMANNRPLFKVNDLYSATEKEYAGAAATYLAYSGPFYVNEDERSLKHEMTVSLFPNWLNNVQVRLVKIEDGNLHLGTQNPVLFNGKMQEAFLIWKRKEINNK